MNLIKNTRKLVKTENNAYSMVLLVEGEKVVGAWDYEDSGVKEDFENPGDLRDWQANCPDETKVSDYGEAVEEKANAESYTLTAISPIGGVGGRGWSMNYEHGDEKWSSDHRGDSNFYSSLSEAREDMDRQAENFEEFVTLSVDGASLTQKGSSWRVFVLR